MKGGCDSLTGSYLICNIHKFVLGILISLQCRTMSDGVILQPTNDGQCYFGNKTANLVTSCHKLDVSGFDTSA